MNLVVIDFETYFDADYSLRKLTTEAYIRDDRFEVHGAAVRWPDGRCTFYEPDWLAEVLATVDWPNTSLLAHHCQFDGAILAWRYGHVPALYLDTMAMARAVLPPDAKVSLDALAKRFGLSTKSIPYDKFKGSHWGELSGEVQAEIAAGACVDVRLSYALFEAMVTGHREYSFPRDELPVIDTTIRMFTQPVLEGDRAMLAGIWEYEDEAKEARFARVASDAKAINGTESFAALLREEGVEPPVKPGKNGPIYCFAKTDAFMRDLLEHPCERVADLAAARLGVRSTIDQTRAERLGWMASRGKLPVYLGYSAALTRRWGGGDKVNWQNLPRLDKRNPRKGLIRKAIKAPHGYLIGKVDASQIECRILNTHAGQKDIVKAFAEGRDLYCELASRFYGRTVTKADEAERGVGKQLELSCGYGAGAATIIRTARMGTYGPPVELTPMQGEAARDLYRFTHADVVEHWRVGGSMLHYLSDPWDRKGRPRPLVEWGPLTVFEGRIFAPGGLFLDYSSLKLHDISSHEPGNTVLGNEWRVQTRTGWRRMYGAKLVENVTQFLARVLLGQAIARMKARGLRIILTVHDDVYILIARDEHMHAKLKIAEEEMTRVPAWMPDLPLACEGKLMTSLGDDYNE